MDDADYKVTITMSADTVTKLADAGFWLYGFKGFWISGDSAVPLLWFRDRHYGESTVVSWPEQYEAYSSYISHGEDVPRTEIVTTFSAPIELGQTLEISAHDIGTVISNGIPQGIAIYNMTTTQYTCGLSMRDGGSAAPFCAAPLYGGATQVFAPCFNLLLMFSTDPISVGHSVEQSSGPALLIDLTTSHQREISYDIDQGWGWNNATWARRVALRTALAPLLNAPPNPA